MPTLNWIGKDDVVDHHKQVLYAGSNPITSYRHPLRPTPLWDSPRESSGEDGTPLARTMGGLATLILLKGSSRQ